ncbi:MAG: PulJ/GspJ family protein [Thermodesulfobacteriota bacterium]
MPKIRETYKRIRQIMPIQSIEQSASFTALGTLGIRNFRHLHSGFTLLEILIAIVIFATLLTTIYASYTGTFKLVEDTESQAEIYRMARIAMDRMIEDLESLYIQNNSQQSSSEAESEVLFQFFGEEREIMGQRADTLRFISSSHIDFSGKDPAYGPTQISYSVKESENGEGFILYRSDNPLFKKTTFFDEESDGLILCEGLDSVVFTYHGEDGQTFDNWDYTDSGPKKRIPKAVAITLEFKNILDPERPMTFTTSVALPMEEAYL